MSVLWKKLPLDTSPSIQADLPLEHNTTLPFNIYSFALASIFLRGCTYLPILIHLVCRLDGGRERLAERPFERRKRSESRTNFLYIFLDPDLQVSPPSFGSAVAYALCRGSHSLLPSVFLSPGVYPFPFLSLLRLCPRLASDVGWWPTAIGRGGGISVGTMMPAICSHTLYYI